MAPTSARYRSPDPGDFLDPAWGAFDYVTVSLSGSFKNLIISYHLSDCYRVGQDFLERKKAVIKHGQGETPGLQGPAQIIADQTFNDLQRVSRTLCSIRPDQSHRYSCHRGTDAGFPNCRHPLFHRCRQVVSRLGGGSLPLTAARGTSDRASSDADGGKFSPAGRPHSLQRPSGPITPIQLPSTHKRRLAHSASDIWFSGG